MYRGTYAGCVISSKSRSQCTHTQNLCPDFNSSLPSWIWIIFHTIVVHDPRVCHDLDQRSYIQGQGHSAHIPKIRVWSITPHCQLGSGLYFTQLSMIQGCFMALTQAHIFNVKSQCTHIQNPCPDLNSSLPCWIWIISYTIVLHDLRVCHDLDRRSYLQGQGHSAHIPKICVRAITAHCQVGSG